MEKLGMSMRGLQDRLVWTSCSIFVHLQCEWQTAPTREAVLVNDGVQLGSVNEDWIFRKFSVSSFKSSLKRIKQCIDEHGTTRIENEFDFW